eukprot:CAMPEP_0179357734 /NCGR_PEP_ID=MMETSP0797-20121207/78561_1 /TAXON_ID=47934 /ORGANISM="Dinophysis acuminata, Strain DAEP01" /LENGTH=270 /DNA_ID=CAMNT_0021072961 /DNA_START=61 /DNA_END=874 /DNA_ORIENTATION=+
MENCDTEAPGNDRANNEAGGGTTPDATASTCSDGTFAAKTRLAGADEQSNTSSASELECAICYHTYCEPVRAACDRHIFCRQCLWKMQHPNEPLRCPICRAAGAPNAEALEEVADIAAQLRARDSAAYDERARELEASRRSREMKALRHESWHFEVCGAGCEETNGVYVADVLPTYLGPTVYRKPNTFFFMFRWHRTQWVIAELRDVAGWGTTGTVLGADAEPAADPADHRVGDPPPRQRGAPGAGSALHHPRVRQEPERRSLAKPGAGG